MISATKPPHLQGDHEEADTLIAFHAANVIAGYIKVGASDTRVGDPYRCYWESASRSEAHGGHSPGLWDGEYKTINVSNTTEVLQECKSRLPQDLPGFYAFIGCDFTSAFYR